MGREHVTTGVSHGNEPPASTPSPRPVSKYLPARPPTAPDVAAFTRFLYPRNNALRQRVLEFTRDDPVFRRRYDASVAQQRELTSLRIQRLVEAGFFEGTITGKSLASSEKYSTVYGTVALIDHSLEVKIGVSYGLFGASIRALGTPEQREYWLPRIERGVEHGCFSLTELGHGSNVRGIRTTATYRREHDDFVLHTPDDSAQKYWIGGLAQTATATVVFAKLHVAGKDHGIHVFVIRIRDHASGRELHPDRLTIADCGAKVGLNGVDNGRAWFDHLPIPKTALLSRLSHVDDAGVFRTNIPSPDARFSTVLAALTGGRVSIALMAVKNAALGLTIAVRYSVNRRAFAPPDDPHGEEVPLLFYKSHQRRLMVPLAAAPLYYLCARDLQDEWDLIASGSATLTKGVHLVSAGYKACFTWFMQDALQAAREACGGQGYKADSEIGIMKADRDVMLTFEGANNVLLQQVCKQLLADMKKAHASGRPLRFDPSSVLAPLNNTLALPRTLPDPLSLPAARALMLDRERRVLDELWALHADRLTARRGDAFRAWNDCVPLAERAAVAHIQRAILDALQLHVEHAQSAGAGVAHTLHLCTQLWAAHIVTTDPDFVRLGTVSPAQATRVAHSLDTLCEQVAAVALDIVDSFDFPDHLLSPLAGDWVKHNARAML